ncbi:MAG TPA: ABC transporter ATP-binding protein [Acidimicrobiales bacterium]
MTATLTPAAGGLSAVGVPADAAVVVRGLRRAFGDREVLRDIDFTLGRRQFVALLGRSGSGKSTILRALAGLDPGAVGELWVPARRSVVYQEPRLLPWARVLANVVLGLEGRDASARGRAALDEVGLHGHEDDWPKTLSGGEAQRVALARALVREPQLLLLDEPFGALDALTRIRMHALVVKLCQRHHPAVLLVTHDVDEAILLADRVLVLTEGRLSLDVIVDLEGPRLRSDPAFGRLRSRLLAELGVDESAESARAPSPTANVADADADLDSMYHQPTPEQERVR